MSTIAPTYSEFIERYPAFAEMTQPSVQAALTFSARVLDSDSWGEFFSDAVALDAAHNLVIESWTGETPQAGFKGTMGPINSVSAAGVNTSFESNQVQQGNYADSWYNKTAYGQKFLRLRTLVIPPGCLSC